jgi:glycosyltransferase involved in cell wall biosynthesis
MKIGIISHILPPSSSGQAMVLHRLLKDIDPESYCLISQKDYNSTNPSEGYTNKLRARYYKIFAEPRTRDPSLFSQGYLRALGLSMRLFNTAMAFIGVPLRGIQIAWVLHKEKCQAVIACTADLVNVPAGYLASRLVGVPYYPYIFDYYSYQWTEPFYRFLAGLFEPMIVKGAERVIVPNECLREELKKRFGVNAAVIHNPCDLDVTEGEDLWPSRPGVINIVYTGAVYYVHYDAFRNLVSAIKCLDRKDVTLHIYTSDSHSLLQSKGIQGPVVYHDHLELSKALEAQKQADILFLPLAFSSSNPEIVKTSSPGKMGEYLASGRPILVHAPEDSFVSRYFRRKGCGVVVDENDAAALSKAILRIIESKALRDRLTSKARECAVSDFGLKAVRARFLALFDAGN